VRVLHVEDNPFDADLTRRHMAGLAPDIQLEPASTLAAALERLRDPAGIDALLIDLSLPDGSGLDLLARVREEQLPLAVVMLTGSGDQAAAIAALRAGADDYLAKGDAALERLPATLRHAWKRFHEARHQRSRPLRVLYAEHHAADIDLTRRHLDRHAPHIRLTVVENAGQVLERLPTRAGLPADYDVVLLDYRLPEVDALEAVKVLRGERGLDIPIVIVSGQGGEEVAAQAFHLGVDDYISKHAGYLHELPATLDKVQRQAELARERGNLRATSRRLEQVLATSPVILYTLRLGEGGATPGWVSGNIGRLLGYSEGEALRGDWWLTHLHPADRDAALANVDALLASGHLVHEYRFFDSRGRIHWIHDELRLTGDTGGAVLEAIGAWRDITDAKVAEQLQQTRIAVLDGLVGNRPLPDILGEIVTRLEGIHPDMRVSILVRDARDGRLFTGAAPSLPAAYNSAVDGLEPGVGRGSCGTAAALGETVIVEDIQNHPYWSPYAHLAVAAGLRACWSLPFRDEAGKVLGTFGIYRHEPGEPSKADQELVEEFSRLAGLAVQKVRADTEALQQAAALFENTRDGVVITDLTPRILSGQQSLHRHHRLQRRRGAGPQPQPGEVRPSRRRPSTRTCGIAPGRSRPYWQGEVWNRRKTGEICSPSGCPSAQYRTSTGLPRAITSAVMTDISQLRQSEAKAAAPGAPRSRSPACPTACLLSRLQHAVDRAERHAQQVAVLYLDLDRFKNVNDSLGHPVGDELLTLLASRLSSRLREEDTLARLGGDEFLLVLESIHTPGQAATVAQALIDALATPFQLAGGQEIFIGMPASASACFLRDARSVTELIQHADVAMYLAKESGRNTCASIPLSLTRSSQRTAGAGNPAAPGPGQRRVRAALPAPDGLHGGCGRAGGAGALATSRQPG
jgi:diguanylate cyclase (GGDEF)-like protein/PAS domain S-box-containing protein